MSKVEALVNAESATIYGANFTFEYILTNSLRTRNDLTITKGEDSEGFSLRHVPPIFGSSHLILENQKLYLDLYVHYSGKFNYDQLAPDEQDKPHIYLPDENGNPYSPSWWTLNLKSNYKLTRKVTLGAGVENILDKRYRTYSSGIVSPGVNFIFSVNARF
jgi:hemoglobin/transferrin/lactoferrin receptor protein